MLVVVTRLQAEGWQGLRGVAALSGQVVEQLRTQPGFLGARLLLDRHRAAWTMTGWSDRRSLEGFREAHAPMTARLSEVATGSASTAWIADTLPRWQEVATRWPAVPPPVRGLRRTVTVGQPVPAP